MHLLIYCISPDAYTLCSYKTRCFDLDFINIGFSFSYFKIFLLVFLSCFLLPLLFWLVYLYHLYYGVVILQKLLGEIFGKLQFWRSYVNGKKVRKLLKIHMFFSRFTVTVLSIIVSNSFLVRKEMSLWNFLSLQYFSKRNNCRDIAPRKRRKSSKFCEFFSYFV